MNYARLDVVLLTCSTVISERIKGFYIKEYCSRHIRSLVYLEKSLGCEVYVCGNYFPV